MEKKKINIQTYHKIMILSLITLMVIFAFVDFQLYENTKTQTMITNSILRTLGGLILIVILIGFGEQKILKFKNVWKSLLIMIPAFIVSVNNFPIIAFLDGRAILTEPVYQVYLYLIECFSVGFFEEIVFRGILLILLLKKFKNHPNKVLLSIVISSVIFGLSHIVNLFYGLSLGDTMLQIMYSFLVGMLWAIMFLRTGNLWLTMLLHATFNFFGQVMFYLGTVNHRYDIYTVIITILFGIFAALYSIKLLKEIDKNPVLDI
jgi:membrane protease YdiL (CAAX protease family)